MSQAFYSDGKLSDFVGDYICHLWVQDKIEWELTVMTTVVPCIVLNISEP